MKDLLLIANWKSNKTINEAHIWLAKFFNTDFVNYIHTLDVSDKPRKKIIICPPDLLLPQISAYFENHNFGHSIEIGAQDISAYPMGSYTGQEPAQLIKEYATYAIIGHSERRKYFNETDDTLSLKVEQALSLGIIPIYCISSDTQKIPSGVNIVAYEPLSAIGSGNPEEPAIIDKIASSIKQRSSELKVLYGGSVDNNNVSLYTNLKSIDGVLVGKASLDPESFSTIIRNA